MSQRQIQAAMIFEGHADASVLWLDDPLSFWGGFDPVSGIIIDNHHPQRGECVQGRILVLPATRGSGGTPGGLAEAIRNGSGPAGIVVGKAEANLMVGAAVAHKLYGQACPVVVVSPECIRALSSAKRLVIDTSGLLTVIET